MSVKVNLLPQEVGERSRAGRQRAVTGAAFGILLLGIGGAWWWNGGRVDDARTDLATAEDVVAMREVELGELAPFAELRDREAAGAELLQSTLGDEVSVAGVLQDLSSVFPPNAELATLSVTITGDRSPQAGGERVVVGSVNGDGYLLLGVAPGAERLLIDVGRAAAFENVFVSTALDEATGADSFQFDLELGHEARSGRYSQTATATTVSTEVAP